MFTGIVEEVGTLVGVEPHTAGARLRIRCAKVLDGSPEGASIAVNGVCLTATTLGEDSFTADVSPETLERSTLGALSNGAALNLERALAANGRLGGHIMQGHVDGVGTLLSIEQLGDGNWWLRVEVPDEVERYCVFKGSIAIDGISLTIAALEGNQVSVALIPHSYRSTNLPRYQPGARLNLECDILAKYVEKMLAAHREPHSTLTMDKLAALGY